MAKRFPFSGIPAGWYAVASCDELPPGGVLSKRYFGRDLVLFRTSSGEVCLAAAHCPHMGAHLGRGRVEGERLHCPFHGFQFAANGRCLATPYGGRIPERAQLTTGLVREHAGLFFAWFDSQDGPARWEIPRLDLTGWLPPLIRSYEIASHPQETTENSVDFGHFTHVHGFAKAEIRGAVKTDGPRLSSQYGVDYRLSAIGLPNRALRLEFEVEAWGLGYSLVKLQIPGLGGRLRLFVLPTPIDEEHVELRLSCMSSHSSRLAARAMRRLVHLGFCREVEEDIPVWTSKAYVDKPALVEQEWPVAEYRRWARQFYPDSTRTA